MRNSIFILFLGILFSLTSCRKDFDTVQSTGTLQFSKETVYLDTVFTNIGSSTYTLKVYNRSKNDIVIPTIKLGRDDSKYRIMVDGMTGNGGSGKVFSNVELLAKDSLFIFIETTAGIADANPDDFLYTDEIQFYGGGSSQKVDLVTLVQDAVFLYPERFEDGSTETVNLGVDVNGDPVTIYGFDLNENDPIHGNELTFTNKKPYVIYGFATVPDDKTLTIQAGARVHFHSESGILVQQNGTLHIEGLPSPAENPLQNEVVFEGDRLEPLYENVPGQWAAIRLRGTQKNNTIEHLTLKNAVVGLYLEAANLDIKDSQFYDCSNFGILARASNITGTNLVLNNSGQANFAGNFGGNYTFKHCTFNNNWASSSQVAVTLNNYLENADGTVTPNPLETANFYNCIIYGSNRVELLLDKVDGTAMNFDFNHCLIKFNESGTALATDPSLIALYAPIKSVASGNFFDQDPKFQNISRNKLNINDQSPAVGKANPAATYFVQKDILGIDRLLEIGAYAARPFPE